MDFRSECSEEIAIERWENEGGEVKPLPEMRTDDNRILICVVYFAVLPFVYWLLKSDREKKTNLQGMPN